ncbi:glycosyl hydrolase [Brevibacterium sp. 91QC2O2]|uniref:glycoside hydrolase family 3 N-terminal domain-containing protein n=1 Tax=Brevibacterium sp. 91QC2O2 TaxID=2968458 RepID=UPI00211C5773|nr:glycoside hydrolase family 3 N-terminal domain-containing protein [Brevibacterium sp. 91QC2O2]MCQ9367298.1 glycosyl hydrolase [Brevibacterium sp. 91QC2O2]
MRKTAILALTSLLALAGCSGSGGAPQPAETSAPAQQSTRAGGGAETAASAKPGAPAAAGVSAKDRNRAQQIVADMDTAELAGSVVIAQYDGTDPQTAQDLVEKNHLAGAIVMGYNLPQTPTADAVRTTTRTIGEARGDRAWPVFIGVDQEGGPVARLKDAATGYPPLMAAGAARDAKTITAAYSGQGGELRELGFTADFAPDADVTIGAADPTINIRSAGDDPKAVGKTVAAAITGYNTAGVASSAKHFPGHGALTVDSHSELPVSKKSIKQMKKLDLVPFTAADEAGVPMTMVGHIGLPGNTDVPASLSPAVYKALRAQGFDGVAVTDALNMGAIKEPAGQETVKAIRAGADLALMPADTTAAIKALTQAIDSGDISKKRITEAAGRVVAMQLWQDRAAAQAPDHGDARAATKAADTALTGLSEKSLSVLKGACTVAKPAKAIHIVGGEEPARKALTRAARAVGLSVRESAGSGTTSVALGTGTSARVVVNTGAPWKKAPAGARTVLATYSDNPHAMAAVAKYLAGELEATGRVPAAWPGTQPKCARD